MKKGRLEAFSDGVMAIIITIMVLELDVPEAATFEALRAITPIFLSYVLSFTFVGIYWNNHHHLFQATEKVDGRVLWANMHLLFWLSLVPFVTAWMGVTGFGQLPVALYGVVLMMAGGAYYLLTLALVALHGRDSRLARALGDNRKELISTGAYTVAIGLAFVASWLAGVIYVFVAAMWLIPDRRMERIV